MLFLELNLITDDIEFDWPIFVEICKPHKLGDRFGNSQSSNTKCALSLILLSHHLMYSTTCLYLSDFAIESLILRLVAIALVISLLF